MQTAPTGWFLHGESVWTFHTLIKCLNIAPKGESESETEGEREKEKVRERDRSTYFVLSCLCLTYSKCSPTWTYNHSHILIQEQTVHCSKETARDKYLLCSLFPLSYLIYAWFTIKCSPTCTYNHIHILKQGQTVHCSEAATIERQSFVDHIFLLLSHLCLTYPKMFPYQDLQPYPYS